MNTTSTPAICAWREAIQPGSPFRESRTSAQRAERLKERPEGGRGE
jgi:hypothetical protein